MREVRSEEAVAMRGRVGWMATDQTRSGWGGREVIFWSFIIAIWRGVFGGAETRNDDNTARSLGCRNISTSRRARHNAVNRSQSLSLPQYFPIPPQDVWYIVRSLSYWGARSPRSFGPTGCAHRPPWPRLNLHPRDYLQILHADLHLLGPLTPWRTCNPPAPG